MKIVNDKIKCNEFRQINKRLNRFFIWCLFNHYTRLFSNLITSIKKQWIFFWINNMLFSRVWIMCTFDWISYHFIIIIITRLLYDESCENDKEWRLWVNFNIQSYEKKIISSHVRIYDVKRNNYVTQTKNLDFNHHFCNQLMNAKITILFRDDQSSSENVLIDLKKTARLIEKRTNKLNKIFNDFLIQFIIKTSLISFLLCNTFL